MHWYIVKKDKRDFCAESYPWKVTSGSVCSDHKTYEEACQAYDEIIEAKQ